MKNLLKLIVILLLIWSVYLMFKVESPISDNLNDPFSSMEVVSINVEKYGLGMKAVAEIRNNSLNKVKGCANFIVRKNGMAIAKHCDPFETVGTEIVDAYFDYNPDEVSISIEFSN